MSDENKVVNIAEVKEDIALVEEEANVNVESSIISDSTGDQDINTDQKVCSEDDKVVSDISKTDKVKNYLKRNYKKIAIGAGILAVGVAGYCIGKKVGSNTGTEKLLDNVMTYLTMSDKPLYIKGIKDDAIGTEAYAIIKLIDKAELPKWLESTDNVICEF